MHLSPVSDLAQAANLQWLIDVRPRQLFADPEWTMAVRELFTDDRFQAFARRHGGIDLRQLDEFVIAGYPDTTLFLTRGFLDPARVEGAFVTRAKVDGRAVDRKGDALGTIVRSWGTVNGQRQQLAIFGREAAGLEVGRFGPLRVGEFFAQERLKKASPALRATPLDRTAAVLGDAPLRAVAPGPFSGEWGRALGGLLGASTAIGMAVRPAPSGQLEVRMALLGAWSPQDREGAGQRLAAALHVLSESSLGRLCGLDNPTGSPTVRFEPDALVAEMKISAVPLFRGLNAATGAGIEELMQY
jgi:hypothetical protein